MNYDEGFHPDSLSLWRSVAVSLDENGFLVFTYQVSRAGTEDPKENMGLMQVHIDCERGRRPERLQGIFQDASPSGLRGSITWMRDAAWSDSLAQGQMGSELE